MDDQLLLQAILAEDDGTILNILQAAAELPGTIYDRLSMAYYELTNRDPGAETNEIGLQ